ncbi:MAG: hypothetical protein HOB82_08470 [Alphaproteobacteria bacterium]|jgi:protein ImuA|nr:hypothetical protein [Alphaproteobacteria bacterium]MBT4711542.1 hypothetical protein [Alphaproteobacteria bacterium]
MALAATVQELRAQVRAIEAPGARAGAMTLGHQNALPDLALGCLHEVTGDPGDLCAATGFAAGLVARLSQHAGAGAGGPVLWCGRAHETHEHGGLYAPGLDEFGLGPERLLVVRARTDTQVLWAMEEGLRCRALSAVVGELDDPGFTPSRRLQLAAEAGGVTAVLLRTRSAAATGAVTRWHVTSASTRQDEEMNVPRWQVQLERHRGGDLGGWNVEWRNETGDFSVAASVRDVQPQSTKIAS